MPPVPSKHTSNILSSILYLNPESGHQFIIALLTEIEVIYLIILSRMKSPALFHFQYILLGNPSANQYLFSAFITNNFLKLLCLFQLCTILAHTIPPVNPCHSSFVCYAYIISLWQPSA